MLFDTWRPSNTRPKTKAHSRVDTSNRFGNLQDDDGDSDDDTHTHTHTHTHPINKAPRWSKGNASTDIMSVDVNRPQEIGAVTHTDGKWERIPVKIDSGAIDTVMPPTVAKYFNTVQTEMSQKGPGFRAANGSPIKHYGQKTLEGIGDHYQPLNMTAQVADVKTTLGSVNQMLKAGNRVH